MECITIITWNVNSIRARIVDEFTASTKFSSKREIISTSALGKLITRTIPTIICFQETKLQRDTEKDMFNTQDYTAYWNSAKKKGYSGVSIWTKIVPEKIETIIPTLEEDHPYQEEGRFIAAHFSNYIVLNTYVPNTIRAGVGNKVSGYDYPEFILGRKVWDQAIGKYITQQHKEVIWCGDLNVARGPLDNYKCEATKRKLQSIDSTDKILVNKVRKTMNLGIRETLRGGGAGYRLEERESIQQILSRTQLRDVFRTMNPTDIKFTYWDLKKGVTGRNADLGLRIDYFMISPTIDVKEIYIHDDLVKTDKPASDHAPISLTINEINL